MTNDEFNAWLSGLSHGELQKILREHLQLLSIRAIGEYTCYPYASIKHMATCKDSKILWKRINKKRLETLVNLVIFIPQTDEPKDFMGYRFAFAILTELVDIEKFMAYYGWDVKKYDDFMDGYDDVLTMDELKMIYHALQLRPLDRLDPLPLMPIKEFDESAYIKNENLKRYERRKLQREEMKAKIRLEKKLASQKYKERLAQADAKLSTNFWDAYEEDLKRLF